MSPLRQHNLAVSDEYILRDQIMTIDDSSPTSSPSTPFADHSDRISTSYENTFISNTPTKSMSEYRSRLSSPLSTPRYTTYKTYESRRLFGNDDDSVVNGESLSVLQLSPPRTLPSQLRPINLSLELQSVEDQLMDAAHLSLNEVPRKKRTAGEVRESPTVLEKGTTSSVGGACLGSMNLSPHISPNSFLTMDGRFVQSKNPFSSPMMTEEDIKFISHTAVATTSAPPLPVSFYNSKDANAITTTTPCAYLPPRHQYRDTSFPLQNYAGEFKKKFFFTGSPIQEDESMEESSTDHSAFLLGSNFPESSSHGGALTKVRRFNESDDVVAASGHEVSSYKRVILVNTTTKSSESSIGSTDPSPSDVYSFPTPPTPVKLSKHNRKNASYFYNMIRQHDPNTPGTDRVRAPFDDCVDTKTPHPGGSRYQPSRAHQNQETSLAVSRFSNDFDVIGELGKGGFGCVYKVLSRLDGCMYAIKVAKRQAKGSADRDRMLKEVYALAALSDQADTATFHIVRYHQAWMEDDRLYIQTELCSGTLAGEAAVNSLTEPRRFKVLREILLALDLIHRQHMVHLDIKPDNIFLKNDQYKLGDFGLVTRASSSQDLEEGDSRYMSMELLSDDRSNLTKSDIFSLGATLYEISLRCPLPMNGPEWQAIRHGELANPIPNTSGEMAAIIASMMNPTASHRPSADQLLQYPQLLSEEQKALQVEKNRVLALQLAHVNQHFPPPAGTLPQRKVLMRSNTWNGSTVTSSF